MSGQWVDLPTAAELLDTTTEAVRKRASRGTLRSERHDGRVVVWVDDDLTEGGREAQIDRETLLEAKDEMIQVMKEQLRLRADEIQRRDVIISQLTQANAALAQRVPELEAPAGEPMPSQTHDDAARGSSRNREGARTAPVDPEPQNGSDGVRKPWYRRWFSG